MKALYGFLAFVILIAFFLSPPCVGAEKNATTEVTLRSDELYYDPNSGKVTAKGSVEVTREDLVVKSPFAEGFIDGREFRFWNGVDASWPSREANLTCLELKMTKDERGTLLRASGKSHMIRGKDEEIRCNDLEWLDGKTIYYSAMGNVKRLHMSRSVSLIILYIFLTTRLRNGRFLSASVITISQSH